MRWGERLGVGWRCGGRGWGGGEGAGRWAGAAGVLWQCTSSIHPALPSAPCVCAGVPAAQQLPGWYTPGVLPSGLLTSPCLLRHALLCCATAAAAAACRPLLATAAALLSGGALMCRAGSRCRTHASLGSACEPAAHPLCCCQPAAWLHPLLPSGLAPPQPTGAFVGSTLSFASVAAAAAPPCCAPSFH